MRKMIFRGSLIAIAALILALLPVFSNVSQARGTDHSQFVDILGLHVQGNTLVDGHGKALRLLGVNRSGTEYMCTANAGIFDGPSDAASVDAIASWHVNAVRVPLNEDCWLGINGVSKEYAGWNYRAAIIKYVALLNSRGIVPVLDLHWSAPGSTLAVGQREMPDVDHSITFWQSVASVFKYDSAVIFNLFNEPHADSDGGDCWRNGSSAPSAAPCASVNYAVAGMQTLVAAIRQVGANNVIMLDGWGYANYIGGVLPNLPTDPKHNLMVSAHVYNFSGCTTTDCFNQQYKPVADQLPLVLGEIGENDCQHGFIDGVMDWADQNGVGYLGWAWDTYDCGSFPSLISDYNGTPTPFGQGLKDRLASF